MSAELLENKDGLVIKAAYGRFSEEVYIGRMLTQEEWEETIQFAQESDRQHIVQESRHLVLARVMYPVILKSLRMLSEPQQI
jgi:uncharacterized circularly permuted ATP-grasp superfamily protein